MADQILKTGEGITNNATSGVVNGIAEPPKAEETLSLDKIPEDLINQLSARIEEKFKNEISSRDKKITEYQKSLKEKELEGKTEKEKAEMLQQQKEKELQEKQAEFEVAQANFLKTKLIAEEKIDPSAIELVTGRTDEEIKGSVKRIKDFWAKAEQAGIEKALKGVNTTPQKNQSSGTGSALTQLQSQLNEAKKVGNALLASKILRQIEIERNKI